MTGDPVNVTVVVQGTLHTEFLINRKRVLEAMSVEARRLGLDATWDWTVYRLPGYRRLLEHAGIGNTISFAMRAGGRTHESLATYRDAATLGLYLDSVRHMGVFDGFAVLLCERSADPRPPKIFRCDLGEFPKLLGATLRRGVEGEGLEETLFFVTLPQRERRTFAPA